MIFGILSIYKQAHTLIVTHLLLLLDARVQAEREVDEPAHARDVFFFSTRALGLVFLFCVPLVVAAGKIKHEAMHGKTES